MTIVRRSMISHLAIPRLVNDGISICLIWVGSGFSEITHLSIHPSINDDKMRKFNSCAKNNCNGELDRRAHIKESPFGEHIGNLGNTLGIGWGNTSIKKFHHHILTPPLFVAKMVMIVHTKIF